MNEVQKLQLDLLIKLDEVCHAHGLRYYLAYGTCIGALRHKGFIPWDHDVDVMMPIRDAKALEQYQDEFGEDYFVTSYRTDPSYRTISMRITDLKHATRSVKCGKVLAEGHLSMDIYPFYNCPVSTVLLKRQIIRSHVYKLLVGGEIKNHGMIPKLLSRCVLLFFPVKRRKKDIEHYERLLDYQGNSDSIADYYGMDISAFNVLKYKKEWFAKPARLEFEGRCFDGPTDADQYLTVRYGDYMTPPARRDVENEVKVELVS